MALLAVVMAIASSTSAFAASADAKKKPKGPKVVVNEACTMLWDTRIEKEFGGTLQVFQEYPTIISGNPNARAAVEDRRAGDALSDDVLTDVDTVGKSAYFNRTKGTITVLVTKKFAFTLQWARAGDVAMTDADQAALVSLAKNVVARATR